MGDFASLAAMKLLALGADTLARQGWLENESGYFFLGVVLLSGLLLAIVRIFTTIIKNNGNLRSDRKARTESPLRRSQREDRMSGA